jgi:hypothetical protein
MAMISSRGAIAAGYHARALDGGAMPETVRRSTEAELRHAKRTDREIPVVVLEPVP